MRLAAALAILSCSLASAAFANSGAAPAGPPSAAAFGRMPAMFNVAMNPSGNLLAWCEGEADTPRFVIFDIEARKRLRTFSLGNKVSPRSIEWASDELALVTISWFKRFVADNKIDREIFQTYAVDATDRPPRELDLGYTGHVAALGTPNPQMVVMVASDAAPKRGALAYSLYHVDVAKNRFKRIESGVPETFSFAVDREGLPIARGDYDSRSREIRIMRNVGSAWQELFRLNANLPGYFGTTADRDAVLAVGSRDGAPQKLWRIPLDGSAPSVAGEDATHDVESVYRDRFTGLAAGLEIGGPTPSIKWLDAIHAARHSALAKAFPGKQVDMYARSENFERVLARVQSTSFAPTYYLVDFSAKTADTIGEEYPELINATLGDSVVVEYQSRDGYPLVAYLTTPPGQAKAKGLPLVVLPHADPDGRDQPGFDWWVQFLATRGYAVVQPQFRGSAGFGEKHRKAGRRQWGKLMQDDLTDAVRALASLGVIDTRRICIVGANYGGYAALAGAAFTPSLYACAASINGISDLPQFLGSQIDSALKNGSTRYWRDLIGWPGDPDVVAISPARSAAFVRAPVLLMQREHDSIFAISQSKIMHRALIEAGRPVTLVNLAKEDHWLSHSSTRTRVLTELESFLGEHLAAPAN